MSWSCAAEPDWTARTRRDGLDRDPDEMPDEVRDDGRRGADEDLART